MYLEIPRRGGVAKRRSDIKHQAGPAAINRANFISRGHSDAKREQTQGAGLGGMSFAFSPQAVTNATRSIQGLTLGSLPARAKRLCCQLPFRRVSAMSHAGRGGFALRAKTREQETPLQSLRSSSTLGNSLRGKCTLPAVTPAVRIRRKPCYESSQASC